MVSTRKTPPAMASPFHSERRQKRMPQLFQQPRHFVETFGTARRQNHHCPRMAGQHVLERRATAALLRLPPCCRRPPPARRRLAESSSAGWRQSPEGPARSHQISDCRSPARGRRARQFRAVGKHPPGLRQKQVNVSKNSLQNETEATVSRPRAIGNARIHHGNSGAAGMRQAQKVRPELSLREDYQPWPQHRQIRSNGKGKIQRKVKDAVLSKMFRCQLLAGGGGGRDHHSIFREAPAQLLHQLADRQHLADRNRVHPDCRHGAAFAVAAGLCPAARPGLRGTCRGAAFRTSSRAG